MAPPRDPEDERTDPNLDEIEPEAPSPTAPPVETPQLFPLTRDVAARGARVRFVEIGEGPPVLMIHGYLANHATWDHLLDSFGTRFRTIAPDLPGFGDSEKPSPSRYAYNADAFAESLVDLVAALGLGRVAVCGHDLGGSVALTMAARHPSIVQRLVLVDPLVYPHRTDVYSRVATTPIVGPITFKQLSGRGLFTRYFKSRNYAAPEAAPAGKVDRFFEHFNAPAARESAYATLESLDDTRTLVALLPRVSVPTLVFWGRHDRLLPLDHGRRLVRELPNATLEILEAGHSPHEERAAEFEAKATAFLSGTPKTRGRTTAPSKRRERP